MIPRRKTYSARTGFRTWLKMKPSGPALPVLPPPDSVFESWDYDPVGRLIGSEFHRFKSRHGIEGLGLVTFPRLDLLAVVAANPGTGQFHRFIVAAKFRFDAIGVWAVGSSTLDQCLPRYGFKKATYTGSMGYTASGWLWKRMKDTP